MNGTVAILTREFSARREVLLVAAATAVIAFAMPLMPGLGSYRAEDVWTVASNTLALAVGWGLALLLGATVFGRDLADGRLGFYFARPVSGLAVWWGRMLGAYLLILASEAVALLPSLFGGLRVIASSTDWGWPAVVAYLAVPFVLLLLAHAVSVQMRARTAWLILDLVGWVVFLFVAMTVLRTLWLIGATTAFAVVGGALAASLGLALLVAGAAGVAVGRTELRRTHGALSAALWSVLAVCTAAAAAYASWLQGFGRTDIREVHVISAAQDGSWVELYGTAPGRLDVAKRFLVSVATRRFLSLGHRQGQMYWDRAIFSAAGNAVVWVRWEPGSIGTVMRADLATADPRTIATTLTVGPRAELELSPDGGRLAVLEQGILSVFELDDERQVTAVRLPPDLELSTMFFVRADRIRLYASVSHSDSRSLAIAEVDVTSGTIRRTGSVESLPGSSWKAFDARLEHVIISGSTEAGAPKTRTLYDARTGVAIRSLEPGGFPGFLSDGRLVWLQEEGDDVFTVVIESPAGDRRIELFLGRAPQAHLCGDVGGPQPGLLIAHSEAGERVFEVLDLGTGTRRTVARGLTPLTLGFDWKEGYVAGVLWFRIPPLATRLLSGSVGSLLAWDPQTGGFDHVVGTEETPKP